MKKTTLNNLKKGDLFFCPKVSHINGDKTMFGKFIEVERLSNNFYYEPFDVDNLSPGSIQMRFTQHKDFFRIRIDTELFLIDEKELDLLLLNS